MRAALQPSDIVLLKDLVFNQHATAKAIATRFRVDITNARRWVRNLKVFGEPYPPAVLRRGRPPLLTAEQDEVLLLYLEERPAAYLTEITYFLAERFDVAISESAVSKHLKKLNCSRGVAQAKKKAELQRDGEHDGQDATRSRSEEDDVTEKV